LSSAPAHISITLVCISSDTAQVSARLFVISIFDHDPGLARAAKPRGRRMKVKRRVWWGLTIYALDDSFGGRSFALAKGV
jgi:hypothetical protein